MRLEQFEESMSGPEATKQNKKRERVELPPWSSDPAWAPPPGGPFAGPGKGARFAGLAVLLLLLLAVAAAGTYLFRNDASVPLDENEIDRLVAEKQAELSSAASMGSTVVSESDGYVSQLYIDSSPPGAVVILDSDTIGVTPLNGRAVEGGVYVLSIRKEHYAPIDTVVFILAEDQAPQFFVDLDPLGSVSQDDSGDQLASRESSTAATVASTRSPGSTDRSESSVLPSGDLSRQDRARQDRAGQVERNPRSSQPETATSGVRVTEGSRNNDRREVREGAAEPGAENAPAVISGLLTVLVKPWGSIYVDGDLLKVNTDVQHTTSLPLGRHVVRAEHPALGSRERVVEIRLDQPQTVVFDLLESSAQDERTNSPDAPQRAAGSAGDGSES